MGGTGDGSADDLKEWSVGPDDETRVIPPGPADDNSTDLAAPVELGGNRLLRIVGRGGMGEVWLALDLRLERHVAIKLMGTGLADDPQAVSRFYREAKAVARLNHPNVVQIHQVGEEKGKPYFAMEWVDGETLGERLRRQGPLALGEALNLLLQAVDGLAYACENGIAHRDVKPGNMLIDRVGRLKIADFGLARFLDADGGSTTAAGVPMGSPNYMSPEQARGEAADHRSDIYSLGITLFQMLTGQLPHAGTTPVTILLKQVQEPLPEPEPLRALAGGTVMEVIRRMTAKRMEERYQTYGELRAALGMLAAAASGMGALPGGFAPAGGSGGWNTPTASQSLTELAPAGASPPPPRRATSWRTVTLVALAALLLGGALGAGIAGWKKMDARRRQAKAAQIKREQANAEQPKREQQPNSEAVVEAADMRVSARPGTGRGVPGPRLRRRFLADTREQLQEASRNYDFAAVVSLMEEMAANRNQSPEPGSEAERKLGEARTLSAFRKALTEEAARQAGRSVRLPGRGMVTLNGATPDGFLLQDAGGERELKWSGMIPAEVLGLARQLLPAGTERDAQEKVFRSVYQGNAAKP